MPHTVHTYGSKDLVQFNRRLLKLNPTLVLRFNKNHCQYYFYGRRVATTGHRPSPMNISNLKRQLQRSGVQV